MRRATPAEVTHALAAVSVWPPDLAPDDRYVALAVPGDRPPPVIGVPAGPPAGSDVGALVTALAQAVGRRLGDPPARVGQSALLMGLASRLWSVTVVPAARDGVLPDPAGLVVRDDDGAIVLGLRSPAGWIGPTAADVHAVVVGVLAPVVGALPLADRLLWGNAAASLHAVPRVHALPSARGLVGAVLDRAPFAGELDETAGGLARRRTCCLFYEVPGAGLCGDCVLDRVPARSA